MSIESKLKNALNSVGDAKRVLRRARLIHPDDTDIKRAVRELEDAETEIERAITQNPRSVIAARLGLTRLFRRSSSRRPTCFH
jgi:hypothetical protein